ncbi:hypothetical protein [Streptomyces tsukubensis]|uniref:hypothetical protein n=1 Tax=Streptomyces tsukubensis TaxID=83656 RepID=UPI00344DB072
MADALGGAIAYASQGLDKGVGWGSYADWGITAVYGEDSDLVGVAVDAMEGPLVSLRGIGLIARVPSAVDAELRDLARREGASVRVIRSGDPEIGAWGVSLGAQQEQGLSPEGYVERRDRAITRALLVSRELADDPYGSDAVKLWRNVSTVRPHPGVWPVRSWQERPEWDWVPLEGIGPLRFGMVPQQVATVLGESPVSRGGRYPYGLPWEGPGEWILEKERFDRAGVTAHYWCIRGRLPILSAVTVHGRSGPQVEYAGIRLIGESVEAVDAALIRYLDDNGLVLSYGCGGDLGAHGLGMYVRATRTGDSMISEARFCSAGWEDHG